MLLRLSVPTEFLAVFLLHPFKMLARVVTRHATSGARRYASSSVAAPKVHTTRKTGLMVGAFAAAAVASAYYISEQDVR